MARLTKYIFIGLLIAVFVYLVSTSVMTSMPVKEGLISSVQYAKDCTCNPGFLPQRCGDPINTKNERDCMKGTYFCQEVVNPSHQSPCRKT